MSKSVVYNARPDAYIKQIATRGVDLEHGWMLCEPTQELAREILALRRAMRSARYHIFRNHPGLAARALGRALPQQQAKRRTASASKEV